MSKKPVSYLAGSMIVGTAIGALVGMLVAPKAGRDTRNQIKTRAGEAPKYLAGQLKELPGRGREALKELPERSREALKALPERFGRRGKDQAPPPPVPGTGELRDPGHDTDS
ncbi:MAG: YtxH domain-containing protein [Candidatus Sericytochromatia bacterium]